MTSFSLSIGTLVSWFLHIDTSTSPVKLLIKENEIARLTIQTLVSDSLMRQILRQLNKLIDVIAVSNEETTYLKGVLLDENLL